MTTNSTTNILVKKLQKMFRLVICWSCKVKGSWGRRLLAVAGEVTQHGWAHPYSWLITIVSLGSKESEESHRSEWKTKLLSMFLAVTCQHASGACQSHSHPVLNLREALRKYIELSPSTPAFLTLQFYEKDLTPTPNLLRISGKYSLRSGISFQLNLEDHMPIALFMLTSSHCHHLGQPVSYPCHL